MKKLILFAVFMLGLFLADTASAQVPSIPRRGHSSGTSAQSQRSSRAAWGTQYDWLSTRYVTRRDIEGYDKGQLRVLRNSIYARYGRKFKDANLRNYFNSQSWYYPRYDEIPARWLNKYEKANISFIKKYE